MAQPQESLQNIFSAISRPQKICLPPLLYGQGRETQIFSRKLGKKTRPLTIKVTVMKESIMEKPVGILACNKVLGQF